MMAALSSEGAAALWEPVALHICIDPSCPLCPHKKDSSRDAPGRILRRYPVVSLDVHCLVSDLPALLGAMATRASMCTVRFTLSNKSNTPVLGKLMESTLLDPLSFNQLRHLTIDSSFLTVVGLPGRVRILQAMGHHLETLTLVGKSVSGIFAAIRDYCPALRELRVDKVESESYFLKYWSLCLEDLTLRRVGFMPLSLREVAPNLRRLALTFTCRHSEAAYASLFASLPSSVRALDIELTSSMASGVLRSLAASMPQLTELRLRGAYDSGSISADAMTKLLLGCPELARFEAGGSLSAFRLRLDPVAVPCLAAGKSLASVTLRYEDRVAEMFPTLLGQPNALRQIVLWEQRQWLPESCSWREMKARVGRVRAAHPGLDLRLEDRP